MMHPQDPVQAFTEAVHVTASVLGSNVRRKAM